jgi:hypothetical protein
MQPTIGRRPFVFSHVAVTLLVCAVLVSVVLGVAGLGATGNLPWASDGDQLSVASQVERAEQVALDAARKEARLDDAEAKAAAYAAETARLAQVRRAAAHKEASLDVEFAAITARPTQTQRVAAAKEARQDQLEQQRTELSAHTRQQDELRRYHAHKEVQMYAAR